MALKNRFCFYILSLVSFILALLSKEAAIFLPFIICGYIFYFIHHRIRERFILLKESLHSLGYP